MSVGAIVLTCLRKRESPLPNVRFAVWLARSTLKRMDERHSQPNPYFAGRYSIFTQLQQYLLDPADRHAWLYTGHPNSGKTALLRQVTSVLDDSVIAVLIRLDDLQIKDEAYWLSLLISSTNVRLERHNLNLDRLPQRDDDDSDDRDWFKDEYFPALIKLIRPHRRLLWLWDDVHVLLNAVQEEILPDDTMEYLHSLLLAHDQLGIVCTLRTEYEPRIGELAPLVQSSRAKRLNHLTEADLQPLIERITPLATTDVAPAVLKATGGHPHLVHHYAEALASLYDVEVTPVDVKAVSATLYESNRGFFRGIWTQLSANERHVLTALAELHHDNPVRKIDTSAIERWLLDSDFPKEKTTINATLRSLEHQEWVTLAEGVRFNGDLWQRWLLEHGTEFGLSLNAKDAPLSRRLRWGLLLAVGVFIVALVLISSQQRPASETTDTPPTVTLAGSN